MKKRDVIYKTGITWRIALSSEETESRLQVACIENIVKFGHVVSEICERTDVQIR